MKQLVYGIQREDQIAARNRPLGIDGAEVSYLTNDGLAAVFSMISDGSVAPDVLRLVAYARVVEELFRRGSVLPMRYGCLLSTAAEVELLLSRNQQAYRLGLEKLEGCVEMGIRVLPAESDLSQIAVEKSSARNVAGKSREVKTGAVAPSPDVSRSGIAYLAARKNHFDQADSQQARGDTVARCIQAELGGVFVASVTEKPTARQAWLVSIHFLIRCEFVERFVAAFHRIEDAGRERLLLTGPWPPYNFVT